jgi:quercetin dioxygenase-like cupin family protein
MDEKKEPNAGGTGPLSQDALSAGAVDLAALVATQPAAVVSRTLVKRPTGTVTLFAFDAGQALSEHTAPFDALVQVLEGEAEVSLGGTLHRVAAGRAILLPAGIPHGLNAVAAFKMLLTMIRS